MLENSFLDLYLGANMNIHNTEQRIDSSPSSARGISRRRFLGMMLAVPAGIIAACSPARPSAPLGRGPGPGESGQDTTGLRSVPAEIKTAIAESQTSDPTAVIPVRNALLAISEGKYDDFVAEFSPDKNDWLRLEGVDEEQIKAFSLCNGVPFTLHNYIEPNTKTPGILALYESKCIRYTGAIPTDEVFFQTELVNNSWKNSHFRPIYTN